MEQLSPITNSVLAALLRIQYVHAPSGSAVLYMIERRFGAAVFIGCWGTGTILGGQRLSEPAIIHGNHPLQGKKLE